MHVTHHHLWLWLWFGVGVVVYMVKRAFYLITGPNPVAVGVGSFLKVAGVPLLFRMVVDSGLYWACFAPELLQSGFRYMGWESAAGVVAVVTQFAVAALFFGLGIDPLVDWVIPTVVGRIPFLKDFWPQMPGPMKPPCDPAPPATQPGPTGSNIASPGTGGK